MKVAVLAPIAWRTPPVHYGPWERVASLITEGLVERGVDVTLFATADSVPDATLDAVAPHGYAEDESMDGRVWEALHIGHALARSGDFDLVHSHLDWLPLALAASWRAPLLTTVHGFSGAAILPAYLAAGRASATDRFTGDPASRVPSSLVAISDSDRSPLLDYEATVHHGIDFSEFRAGTTPGDDLVVFGRIHPHKGTADAIEIARRTGRRLLICGIVQDQQYFDAVVRPALDDDRVVYLGSVGAEDRSQILGAAAVLLHPIHFDEPFGLSVIEAMACGTPVVAYSRGSMREVVDDGVTGVLAHDVAGAVAAVPHAVALDRTVVRKVAERRFGRERMVDDYLAVYSRVIERWRAR